MWSGVRYWSLAAALALGGTAFAQQGADGWGGFACDGTHSGLSRNPSQVMRRIRWKTSVDETGSVGAHYASPVFTRNKTALVTIRMTNSRYRVDARQVYDGALLWSYNGGFKGYQGNNWYSSPTIYDTANGQVAVMPGPGGTVYVKANPDDPNSPIQQVCFYGIDEYLAHKTAYDNSVFEVASLLSDSSGNVYLVLDVTGSNPLGIKSGIVKLRPDGTSVYVSAAQAANDNSVTAVTGDSAPALSPDGSRLYLTVQGSRFFLIGLDTASLTPLCKVEPLDPKNGGAASWWGGTASPMVGPDGDVYFGMFENGGYTHLRGYMLHYDKDLVRKGYCGAFGWDNTPAVVPASAVPSYSGSSSYLIMTKYNNYLEGGGDGTNRIAILDPNDFQFDPIDQTNVMKEVITKLGPTPDPRGGFKEWCINAPAVDPFRRGAVANSEDGNCYFWDFTTNTLSQTMVLTPGLGEGYTSTAISGDGTCYATNMGILFAMGDNTLLPTSYTVQRGSVASGQLTDLWYDDSNRLELKQGLTVNAQDYPIQFFLQTVGFAPIGANGSLVFQVKSSATSPNVQQRTELWDFTQTKFVTVDTRTIGIAEGTATVTVTSNAQRFVDPSTFASLARVSYRAAGIVTQFDWRARLNLTSWVENP